MVKILLAGDSTVSNYLASDAPMCGWGASLAAALAHELHTARADTRQAPAVETIPAPPRFRVRNYARAGATTQTFREESFWDALLFDLAPGDLVVIQFGHNDQKTNELPAFGQFTDNLRRMLSEVAAKGGRPVLCTPVQRRLFGAGGLAHQEADMGKPINGIEEIDQSNLRDDRIISIHRKYPDAIRALAVEQGLPLIDLSALTLDLFNELGPTESLKLFVCLPPGIHPQWPDGIKDFTHFSFEGAEAVAALVARELAPLM